MHINFNRSILIVLVGLLAASCAKDEEGSRNAGTPPTYPPGPLGPSTHVDTQCPQNAIGRFRNQDPAARPNDRFVTVFRDTRNQLVLSLSARPRMDRSTDLPINGMRTNYGEKAHATAFCEKGLIKIFSFSSDGQWFATIISQTSPAFLQVTVTHQGQALRTMNFTRRGQDSRNQQEDSQDENEQDPNNGNEPLPPYDEDEDSDDQIPRPPGPGRPPVGPPTVEPPFDRPPRPRPPMVPPRKEVPPIVKPPRQQPPKKEVPPPTKPPVVVAPPVVPPPVVKPPPVAPPVQPPPTPKPPPAQTPPQDGEVDDLGCPFLTGTYQLEGQDQRMNIKTLSFKRDEQKVLIAGTASKKESFPDIALNGKNLPDGKGGEVSGECQNGLVLLKATTYSNTKLRLEIRKISSNELELKNFVNEKLTKSYKYSKKND